MGSAIADDRSVKFAVFQIIQRVMLHLADVMRHQLSSKAEQSSADIEGVIQIYKRALRLRCTHGKNPTFLMCRSCSKSACNYSWDTSV
jgi:hypothetical protein